MRRTLILAIALTTVFAGRLPAQEGVLDPVSKQATSLEADLSKLRNTSPEAAEVMLKLIDLYHASGRVYGLVRVGQTFVSLHTTHPRHTEAMLKLLDGLVAGGRSKEAIAVARQFLVRNPKDTAAVPVETTLATLLVRNNERPAAAEAYLDLWNRLGPTDAGREAGAQAVRLFAGLNTKDGYTKAATLAEQMLEKLPVGSFAAEVGKKALDNWDAAAEYAKANLAGAKLLARNLPADKLQQREIHRRMAENYARLGQRANAIDSFQKALALGYRLDILNRLLAEMHAGAAKPAEMEPLVKLYVEKNPERPDRLTMRSYLAAAHLRAMDKAAGLAILAELIPIDPQTNDNAATYLRQIAATETDKLKQAEQLLLDALAKNPKNAAYLRYTLAFELYANRLKDPARQRQTLLDLVSKSPSNDGYTAQAINWLLANTAEEAEFQKLFAQLLDIRKQYPHWAGHRNFVGNWVTEAAKNPDKMVKARATWARAELKKVEDDPVFADWVALEKAANRNVASPLRDAFLAPERFKALTDVQARQVLDQHVTDLRSVAPVAQRPRLVEVLKLYTQRFPDDYQAAVYYLEAATDYGTPEDGKAAAQYLLKFEPKWSNPDAWRRLMLAADRVKDAALVKQARGWIDQSHQKFGVEVGNASYIGDILDKYELKAEAAAYWRQAAAADPFAYEGRACAERLLAKLTEPADRLKFLTERNAVESDYHGFYAMHLANEALKANDLATFEKVLRASQARQKERPFRNWGVEEYPPQTWVDTIRADAKAAPEAKKQVYTVVRDLRIGRPSGAAALALLETTPVPAKDVMPYLLALVDATFLVTDTATDFDRLMVYAQAAMTRKDYISAATLAGAMLANIPSVDPARKKSGRDMIAQAYTRLGAAGSVIDENSPIAPLLQAALHLRLGDAKLAFDAYLANRKLFDDNRADVPIDLLLFVCDSHIAAGGDENFNRAEDILRAWLIKNADSKEIDDLSKARVQLLLARNFFRARRYDLARAEFQTVINRHPRTPQAVEAEFGIGETFMEQKVYDQAEQVFEKLAGSRERDIIIRAEFLRGVLAGRRGDRDEARAIFKAVLERVPTIELANEVLYNLAEVYGAEQRYIDQLELLRTVGRLGRSSKRYHTPGEPLSIVVQDSDLGISRGHARIPVLVTTEPGGDEEIIYLTSGGAGKGLFRADLETRLGTVTRKDKVLQLTGKDVIKCDYPDDFKKEFKDVPLPDAEIRIAADGRFEIASQKIVDKDEESLSKTLQREADGGEEEKPRSAERPLNQVKPGNLLYLRVTDPDRDLSDEPDTVTVKLAAASGDQVQAVLTETGPHTGIFEGTARTGELPAGALATNTAIDHSPLMAIDRDKASFWLSEPDGVTPKVLTIDMKELKPVDRVVIHTPDAAQHAPVRGILEGSDDGRFWYRLAANPVEQASPPVAGEFGRMSFRAYPLKPNQPITDWAQVVELSKSGKPQVEGPADELTWTRPEDEKGPFAVLWQGKLVQPRAGAARFKVDGGTTALMIDGRLELPVEARTGRTCDVWLEPGTHDLTILATVAGPQPTTAATATWVREDNNVADITPQPFKAADFDLNQPGAKPAVLRQPATVAAEGTTWDFRFQPVEVRYVRLVVQEYRGEAVAINHVEIFDSAAGKAHVPTDADVLSLANNNVLEIAGGDVVTATYVDDQTLAGSSRLLTGTLTATYFNGVVHPITYELVKQPGGQIQRLRRQLLRIDPGDRFVVEITDYDMDQTVTQDRVKFTVAVNDGPAEELTAQETEVNTGIFTKEVDTAAMAADKKLAVKPGDRIYIRYLDQQNTLPGHAVPRETVVYVNAPTEAKMRIIETRVVPPPANSLAPPTVRYLPTDPKKEVAGVAFEAPFTVEVIDPDQAKNEKSTVVVDVETTAGTRVQVECALADDPSFALGRGFQTTAQQRLGQYAALREGRFVGQIILQLGGKDSPDIVPLTANMPRRLMGGPVLPKEDNAPVGEAALITRVLNLTGKDVIKATYTDSLRPRGDTMELTGQARLLADGKLLVTDADYDKPTVAVHVGEKLYLKVIDPDLDVSDDRDVAKVTITTKRGEKETIELQETLAHSGVFTGSIMLRPEEKPTAGNLKAASPELECWFGDMIDLVYLDESASTGDGKLEAKLSIPVVIGTDGKVAAFTKTFGDEQLAVETQFHVAESHFELFKSHKALGREDEARTDLEAGRRVLREVMEDYPNPKYIPRISYLLGQFAQELKQWNEATDSYQLIARQYPEHNLAPDAQYKLAQCYEEKGEFNKALEEYVALAATYPKSPLIASVMLRLSEHFYKLENFKVAAQVGEKFLEKFEGHQLASKMAFRIGQCYYKDKQYLKAAGSFDRFEKVYPDDALTPDALFWSGESFRMGNNPKEAFIRYNNCRWKFPASESSKYARGRLALPEMLRQFENAANLDNN